MVTPQPDNLSRLSRFDAQTRRPGADFRYLRRSVAVTQALSVSRLSRSVVLALRDGAHSAAQGDTDGLTYADGWAAAATLAQLVMFDALKAPAE